MTTDQLQRQIEDAQVEGWSLDSEQQHRAIMKKHSYGSLGAHVLIFILTFWTLGFGNALYAAYVYFAKADTKVLRVDAEEN